MHVRIHGDVELLYQPNSRMKTHQTGQATTNPEPLGRDPLQTSPAHRTFDCAGPSWAMCVWMGWQVGKWEEVRSFHIIRW